MNSKKILIIPLILSRETSMMAKSSNHLKITELYEIYIDNNHFWKSNKVFQNNRTFSI